MPCIDDPGIADDDDLWRRIPPDWVILDENLDVEAGGRVRPASVAFRDPELSVLLAREDNPERALAGYRQKGFSLAAIKTGQARELRQIVCRKPTLEDRSHLHVEGNKKKLRVDEALALAAEWVGPTPPPTKTKARNKGR